MNDTIHFGRLTPAILTDHGLEQPSGYLILLDSELFTNPIDGEQYVKTNWRWVDKDLIGSEYEVYDQLDEYQIVRKINKIYENTTILCDSRFGY